MLPLVLLCVGLFVLSQGMLVIATFVSCRCHSSQHVKSSQVSHILK